MVAKLCKTGCNTKPALARYTQVHIHTHQFGVVKVPDSYATTSTRGGNKAERDWKCKARDVLRVAIHPAQDPHRVVCAGVPVDAHPSTPRCRQDATCNRTVGEGADLQYTITARLLRRLVTLQAIREAPHCVSLRQTSFHQHACRLDIFLFHAERYLAQRECFLSGHDPNQLALTHFSAWKERNNEDKLLFRLQ